MENLRVLYCASLIHIGGKGYNLLFSETCEMKFVKKFNYTEIYVLYYLFRHQDKQNHAINEIHKHNEAMGFR